MLGKLLLGGLAVVGASLALTQRGGAGARKRPRDFDPTQLLVGCFIEMEHTDDPVVAREIAMDHLAEDPRYYSTLCRWHRERACRLFDLS